MHFKEKDILFLRRGRSTVCSPPPVHLLLPVQLQYCIHAPLFRLVYKLNKFRREREFIFQVNQTTYYYELMNIAKGYQNRQTPI